MGLTTSDRMVWEARRSGYAVLSLSVDNLESVDGGLEAAVELKAPIILQTGQGALAHTRMRTLARLVQSAAESVEVPVALHLDHGRDLEQVIEALRLGYTSVMYDGSKLPFEENVKRTREVVKAARAVGVPVEGELGGIGRVGEGGGGELTDPDEAARFVEETGVDFLAVAVGNIHAAYKQSIGIDVERVEAIARRVPNPLVLHGGTGIPAGDLQAAVAAGVGKFNLATQWRRAWIDRARDLLKGDEGLSDWYKLMGALRAVVKAAAADKIRVLGSAGRADEPGRLAGRTS